MVLINVRMNCVDKCDKSVVVFLVLYVDEILLIENDVGYCHLLRYGCPTNSILKTWEKPVTFLGLNSFKITRIECWAYHKPLIFMQF